MVLPETAKVLFHISQIIFRVGVQVVLGELFQHLSLNLEAFLREREPRIQQFQKFLFILCEIAESGQIDSHHANRTGHGVGAEESASALSELAVVESQPAAH